MSTNAPSFVMKTLKTTKMDVTLAIPPEDPIMRGTLKVEVKILSKKEITEAQEDGVKDLEFYDRIVVGIEGLGSIDGQLMEPKEAAREARDGELSMYLVPAIIMSYYEQFGEARRKNSQTSRKR